MPTPQALESLRILAGNRGGSQVLPMDAYRFAGNVPTQGELESPFEQEQARRAAAADARDREAVSRIQETNAGVEEYNRPDVTSVRNEGLANALKMKLEPIRLQGQYAVEAARQSQIGAESRDDRRFGNSMIKQDDAQRAIDARSAASQKSAGLRQGIAAQIAAKRALLPKASNTGLPSWLGGGPTEKDKLMEEIAALAAQMGAPEEGDTGETPVAAAPVAAPSSAAELLARRRARTGGR